MVENLYKPLKGYGNNMKMVGNLLKLYGNNMETIWKQLKTLYHFSSISIQFTLTAYALGVLNMQQMMHKYQ